MPEPSAINNSPPSAVKRHWSFRDKTGMRFGRLLVLGTREPYEKPYHWRCICDCGVHLDVSAANLGHSTNSCGCMAGEAQATHNMSRTKTYTSWQSMLRRCNNTKDDHFPDYGGRGISVCARWSASFEAFLSDMGVRPDKCTLDRKDVNGNYEPENCRWATSQQQSRNRRSNVMLTAFGKTQCINDWRKVTGLSFTSMIDRIEKGWSAEDVIATPKRKGRISLSTPPT